MAGLAPVKPKNESHPDKEELHANGTHYAIIVLIYQSYPGDASLMEEEARESHGDRESANHDS